MSTDVVVAIVSGAFTFLGVIITVIIGNKKASEKTDLTLYRIKELEKKQSQHNNLVERTYKLEGAVLELQHDVKDLKAYHGIGTGGVKNERKD